MEKDDKGSTMIRMGVSGWMFLLVPAYPGCPGSKAVKRSLYLCKDCYFRFDVNHMQITYAKAKVIWYPALCLDYSEYVYVYMSEICFGFIVVML